MDKKTPDAKKWFGGSTKTLEPQEESPYLQAIVESSDDAIMENDNRNTFEITLKHKELTLPRFKDEITFERFSNIKRQAVKNRLLGELSSLSHEETKEVVGEFAVNLFEFLANPFCQRVSGKVSRTLTGKTVFCDEIYKMHEAINRDTEPKQTKELLEALQSALVNLSTDCSLKNKVLSIINSFEIKDNAVASSLQQFRDSFLALAQGLHLTKQI